MSEKMDLTVSCHCGASNHAFTVPVASLPLTTHLCNCDISRRISGTLLTSYINITHKTESNPTPPTPDLSALTPYESTRILTRYFCSTCGTHMYLEYHNDGHFEAATGTLQVDRTDSILEHQSLMWIEDTLDGGASQFITHLNGRLLKRYLREDGQSPEVSYDWKHPCLQSKSNDTNEDKPALPVHAHCHCNGVQFYVTCPNEKSREAQAGYPDLLMPYLDIDPMIKDNPDNDLWWLLHPRRFLAGTCTCKSCTSCSGFDITCWAFIPISNIFLDAEATRPFTRNPYWGTTKVYESSKGVKRTFCGTCGANVFWDGGDRGGTLVDVAVGLLDAESGARAEEILAWWPGRVSFVEEAKNEGFAKSLQEGLRTWAQRNKGRECVAERTLTTQ